MGNKAGRGGGGAADGVESGTGGEAEMGRGGVEGGERGAARGDTSQGVDSFT